MSRHLKILWEAGLIERYRQGQWVQYRVAADPQAASFVKGLLAQLDRRDALLLADRATARGAERAQGAASVRESRLGRALGQLISEGASQGAENALVAGVTHLELLEAAARITRPASRSPTRVARHTPRVPTSSAAVSPAVYSWRGTPPA